MRYFCQERFPFVAVDERGFVKTDTKGIFAVGDIIPPMGTNPKAYVTGNDGIIKVGFDDTDRLVYCCLIGKEVSEILNLCATLLGKNLEEHLSFAHPSYGEIINEILSIKQEVCR